MAAANRGRFLLSSNKEACLGLSTINLLRVMCRSYAQSVGKAASQLVQKNSSQQPKNNATKNNTSNAESQRDGHDLENVQERRKFRIRPKSERLDIDKVDWPSLYSTASSYNSWLMPLPIRMGRSRHNKVGGLPVRDMGNIELMKIPNFFHLTPPAIERHCEALKDLCTPWPKSRVNRPIRIVTKNFLFASPSIRHPKSHIVQLKVYLRDLILDEHARKKMIELAAHRYNPENDELTITADRCPTRRQNKDYACYLLNVLYHESWKTEPWELEQGDEPEDNDLALKPRRGRKRRKYKIIDNELYRINKYGKTFKMYIKQQGDQFQYEN